MRRTPLARRTPLTATTGLARTTRLNPVSGKRAAENRARRTMVTELYPGAETLCAMYEARAATGLPPLDGCTRQADDLHETLTRARSGGVITDPRLCVPLCRWCNGEAAREDRNRPFYDAGLLFHSWEDPRGAA